MADPAERKPSKEGVPAGKWSGPSGLGRQPWHQLASLHTDGL